MYTVLYPLHELGAVSFHSSLAWVFKNQKASSLVGWMGSYCMEDGSGAVNNDLGIKTLCMFNLGGRIVI